MSATKKGSAIPKNVPETKGQLQRRASIKADLDVVSTSEDIRNLVMSYLPTTQQVIDQCFGDLLILHDAYVWKEGNPDNGAEKKFISIIKLAQIATEIDFKDDLPRFTKKTQFKKSQEYTYDQLKNAYNDEMRRLYDEAEI